MSDFQLIITLTLYIVSMAFAVILSIVRKNKEQGKWKMAVLIHIALLSCFLIFKAFFDAPVLAGYVFLIFFCSGIISGGYLIRSKAPTLLRFYFILYIASIILFIASPSTLVKTITLRFENTSQKDKFNITGNYYLEEEQMLMQVSESMVKYKITQHFGVFHKTLVRNLRFGNRLDSILILSFNPAIGADIRGYIQSKSPTFEGIDSIDVHTIFKTPSKELIQRKKTIQ